MPSAQAAVLSPAELALRARDIRRLILQTVHVAQAGHIGGPLSAAEILSTLYFSELRVDPAEPRDPGRDRFVLSKGHCAVLLYSTLALAGFLPICELATFDAIDSRLQGHPDLTRLAGLDMSTGSLGQGLSAGVGMGLAARLSGQGYRTYVLLGDGECQEGQVWEAAQAAARYELDNLVAIVDGNGLQQYGWSVEAACKELGQGSGLSQQPPIPEAAAKWRAFGWHVLEVDGHDPAALLDAYAAARQTRGQPTAIMARTIKGRGVSFMENDPAWHAKPLSAGDLARALDELGGTLALEGEAAAAASATAAAAASTAAASTAAASTAAAGLPDPEQTGRPLRELDSPSIAIGAGPRDVFARTLVHLIDRDDRLVVLDGDLANSTKADVVAQQRPERFLQLGIAEQNLVGVAAGLASAGYRPWVTTFAAFLVNRALDQIRVAIAQTGLPVRLAGAYGGILTNRTGKSHQAIEDYAVMRALPGMTVLAPADEIELAQAMAAAASLPGPVYMRIARDTSGAVFGPGYGFALGQGVVLREGRDLAVVSTGSQTVRVARALDRLASEGVALYHLHLPTLKPLDVEAIVRAARATGRVLTVEEHVVEGGLGGAVAEALSEHLPVPIKRIGLERWSESGPDDALLDKSGLSVDAVAAAVRRQLGLIP